MTQPQPCPELLFVVAATATISGPAGSLATLTEFSDHVEGWLREYHGYRGVFVFLDADEESSRLITLWETAKDELAAPHPPARTVPPQFQGPRRKDAGWRY